MMTGKTETLKPFHVSQMHGHPGRWSGTMQAATSSCEAVAQLLREGVGRVDRVIRVVPAAKRELKEGES